MNHIPQMSFDVEDLIFGFHNEKIKGRNMCCGSGCFWASRIRIRYEVRGGSGSTSFYQAKIVRKTLISTTGTVLGLIFDFYL
jgi:metal-dependent amidase/aminoacylase/carboxypeptidase family protein